MALNDGLLAYITGEPENRKTDSDGNTVYDCYEYVSGKKITFSTYLFSNSLRSRRILPRTIVGYQAGNARGVGHNIPGNFNIHTIAFWAYNFGVAMDLSNSFMDIRIRNEETMDIRRLGHTTFRWTVPTAYFSDNQWRHILVDYDNTRQFGNLWNLYINGTRVTSGFVHNRNFTARGTPRNTINVSGARFRMWNRILTDTERTSLLREPLEGNTYLCGGGKARDFDGTRINFNGVTLPEIGAPFGDNSWATSHDGEIYTVGPTATQCGVYTFGGSLLRSFNLDHRNTNPTGAATDGEFLYIIDKPSGAAQMYVFAYTLAGTFVTRQAIGGSDLVERSAVAYRNNSLWIQTHNHFNEYNISITNTVDNRRIPSFTAGSGQAINVGTATRGAVIHNDKLYVLYGSTGHVVTITLTGTRTVVNLGVFGRGANLFSHTFMPIRQDTTDSMEMSEGILDAVINRITRLYETLRDSMDMSEGYHEIKSYGRVVTELSRLSEPLRRRRGLFKGVLERLGLRDIVPRHGMGFNESTADTMNMTETDAHGFGHYVTERLSMAESWVYAGITRIYRSIVEALRPLEQLSFRGHHHPPNGLLAHITFDQPAGSRTINNEVAGAFSINVNGATLGKKGIINGAMSIGANNRAIMEGHGLPFSLDSTETRGIYFWYNRSGTDTGSIMQTNQNNITMNLSFTSAGMRFRFIRNGVGINPIISNSVLPPAGRWFHIGIVIKEGVVKLLINGNQLYEGRFPQAFDNTISTMNLGHRRLHSDNDIIDDLKVYDRELDFQERHRLIDFSNQAHNIIVSDGALMREHILGSNYFFRVYTDFMSMVERIQHIRYRYKRIIERITLSESSHFARLLFEVVPAEALRLLESTSTRAMLPIHAIANETARLTERVVPLLFIYYARIVNERINFTERLYRWFGKSYTDDIPVSERVPKFRAIGRIFTEGATLIDTTSRRFGKSVQDVMLLIERVFKQEGRSAQEYMSLSENTTAGRFIRRIRSELLGITELSRQNITIHAIAVELLHLAERSAYSTARKFAKQCKTISTKARGMFIRTRSDC